MSASSWRFPRGGRRPCLGRCCLRSDRRRRGGGSVGRADSDTWDDYSPRIVLPPATVVVEARENERGADEDVLGQSEALRNGDNDADELDQRIRRRKLVARKIPRGGGGKDIAEEGDGRSPGRAMPPLTSLGDS